MADDSASNREGRASSDPKEIPQPPSSSSVKIDYNNSQCASFVSQRSSSLETFGSVNSVNSVGNAADHPLSGSNTNLTKKDDGGSDSKEREGGDASADSDNSRQWLYNNESLPSSMLHPAHRSTPLKESEYLSTVSEEDVRDNEDQDPAGEEDANAKGREIFQPGDLHTPILGFETTEQRSRFTVYKIQVQKTLSESSGWFVFRRYSDFLHLNERLKIQFPAFRLSLPPKRWFRDNFDSNFLEDRVLGLQAFLDNITGHKDICNSAPVRGFLCTDSPPGPHDSLEESRALCETLEETMYSLRQGLQEKESEVTLLKEELQLYKSQVELLTNQLRVVNGSTPAKGEEALSPSSTRHSLAECDRDTPPSPIAGQGTGDQATALEDKSDQSSALEDKRDQSSAPDMQQSGQVQVVAD